MHVTDTSESGHLPT